MKKLAAIVLVFALIMATALTCASADTELVKYTGFAPVKGENSSYLDALAFRDLAEYGIEIELNSVPQSVLAEKRNLLLAGGEYPDFFLNCGVDIEWYGAQEGILLPIGDVITENMPNLMKKIDEYNCWNHITNTDGNIYAIPGFNQKSVMDKAYIWINKVWLDNLNLEVPTSFEGIYEVLKAFKEQDANGNGDASDEIPMLSYINDVNNPYPTFFLMCSYAEWLYDFEFRCIIDEDGTVRMLPYHEEFKDMLAYFAKLYQEGLINEDCFTLSEDSARAMAKTSDNVGMFIGSGIEVVGEDRVMDYCVVEPWADSLEMSDAVNQTAFCFTDACVDPVPMAKWMDTFFTEEGSKLARMGIEGESYIVDENGNWAWNVTDDQDKDYIVNVLCAHGMPSYITPFELTNKLDDTEAEQYEKVQKLIVENHGGMNRLEMPFTDEQLQVGLPVMIDMNTYFIQYIAKVVTGELDLEASWAEYHDTLDKMQVPVLEEIMQDCYDRLTNAK